MGRPARLETFEIVGGQPGPADPATDEAWDRGYEAGYAQAMSDAAAAQARLTDEIVQSLNDQAFGYHEARDHLLRTLRPMFDQLTRVFVPRLARDMLVPRVTEILHDMAAGQMDAPVVLTVSTAMAPRFRSLVDRLDGYPLDIREDADLGDLQAVLAGADAECVLDFEHPLAEVASILAALETQETPRNTENRKNG